MPASSLAPLAFPRSIHGLIYRKYEQRREIGPRMQARFRTGGGLKLVAVVALAVALVVAIGGLQRVSAPMRSIPRSLEGWSITIDPGHGGIDPGCHLGNLYEKDLVLTIAQGLADILAQNGARVTLTRSEDIELSHLTQNERTRHRRDLRARVELASQYAADLLVSLHVNTAGAGHMGGAMLFYHPTSSEGKGLAEALLPFLSEAVPGNQNAALPGNFYILRHSAMPAVLVEMGFLSNPVDRGLLTSSEGQQRITTAILMGLESFVRSTRSDPFVLPTFVSKARSTSSLQEVLYVHPILDGHPCLSQ